MKNEEIKRYGKAAEIEAALIRRMEERYREGNVVEEIAAYFEQETPSVDIPLLMCGKKRKERIRQKDADRAARREVCGFLPDSSPTLSVPPTNRNPTIHGEAAPPSETEQSPKILGGYDGGVELGFTGIWDSLQRSETFAIFEAAKTSAQNEEEPQPHFELNGKMYTMSRQSSRIGRCQYKYVFEGDGVKYYVHSNAKGKQQPIRIRYDATGLIGRDLFFKHAETLEVLKDMGFMVVKETLSRVDMQIMLFCTLTDLIGPRDLCRRHIVCPAQNYQINGKGLSFAPQTFRMGNHNVIQICIYDKRAEMFSLMTKDPLKFNLMLQHCFEDDWLYKEIPTLRVEFRIGRDQLYSMHIDSMQDLLESEAGLARYCCHSWFRIVEEEKKRGHTHEQEVSPLWREVQEAFAKWFPGVDGHNRDVKRDYDRKIKANADHLVKQAVGCMATACALEKGSIDSPHESLLYTLHKMREYIGRLYSRTVERAQALGIKVSGVLASDYRDACDVSASLERVGPSILDPLNDPVPIPEF